MKLDIKHYENAGRLSIPGMRFVSVTYMINGQLRDYCDMGLVKGRNRLTAFGFKQQKNPVYFRLDHLIIHYNSLLKRWYSEIV